MMWINFALPGRPTNGTYDYYTEVPSIPVSREVAHIKTFKDIMKHQEFVEDWLADSPTSCFVTLHKKNGLFYCDQQGCVTWHAQKDGTVSANGVTVSATIPEFLTRMAVENYLWNQAHFPQVYKSLPREIAEQLRIYRTYYKMHECEEKDAEI